MESIWGDGGTQSLLYALFTVPVFAYMGKLFWQEHQRKKAREADDDQ